MIFWIVAGVLSAVVVGLILWGYRRGQSATETAPDAADYDIEVFRSQLDELDRDLERGVIEREQAEAARTEIARRLLTADRKRGMGGDREKKNDFLSGIVPIAVSVVVPFVALGFYVALGSPGMPDFPLSGRSDIAEADTQPGSGMADVDRNAQAAAGSMQDMSGEDRQAMIKTMVAGLRKRMEEETPDDPAGWQRLGRSYTVLGQYEDAAMAYGKLAALMPEKAGPLLAQARALRSAAGNKPTDETVSLMEKAAQIDPGNVEALFFLGLDRFRKGQKDEARAFFARAMEGIPEDSPERKELKDAIERVSGMKLD